MNKRFFIKTLQTIIILSALLVSDYTLAGANPGPGRLKPFRVLVVIGDQWEDPASYMVNIPEPTGEYSGYGITPEVAGAADFHHLCVLLKSWGIPFDVVRLDQQFLDRYMFLDMKDRPRYGTIIWDVNQTDKLLHPDYSIVTEMVKDYGIGLIALSDRISQPEIQSLLGLKYVGSWESNTSITIKSRHFITEGIKSPLIIDSGIKDHMQRQQVELLTGTAALLDQGAYTQATAKEYPLGGNTVWIGNDHNYLFSYQGIRTLLRRAITWTIGYNLYKTWANDLVMIMDDPGTAQNLHLEHWHYPGLSEETIEKYLIRPLQEHHSILNINFVAGFVNDSKRRLEPTWIQQTVDDFGDKQDYVSGKRGYDKGVKLGVFEVMCHGLTHMQPDLVSEPGWYGSPVDKEKAEVGWYREFGDTRRHKEIPAAEQRWRMNTSKKWITEQFGVVPLEFCAGGDGTSVSYFNSTEKLAGEAGFGWCGWRTGYLGKDMIITGWKFFGTDESPQVVGVLPNGHDFGISKTPEAFAAIFDNYPKARFISINEFIGYLHAENSSAWNPGNKTLDIRLDYDPHYCRYFEQHTSDWHLELSDWLIREMGAVSSVNVDGQSVKFSGDRIDIPTGTGKHEIEVRF